MKAVIFELKGSIAHFRRPDTTATHLTYPFITPTAAKGIVGAILGIEDFMTNDKIGIQLLSPVHTVTQQMSMIGKDAGNTFNRPTTIELIVNPYYRIYYAGKEYSEQLHDFLMKNHAVYPVYLGSAYALSKPLLNEVYQEVNLEIVGNSLIETKTIIPTSIVKELHFQQDHYYSRAGGFMYKYKGQRVFEQSINFLYEKEGRSITFTPVVNINEDSEINIVRLGEEYVCLF
ncbi:CRISPR-associated protein Cas5 [Tepidibacillus marianensis]|uniref:CRISPR-associated protein Cas5 n=1 Tax=Tepidibacillus marianensis TaxID=3131995 RepID=UPI0030CB31C2